MKTLLGFLKPLSKKIAVTVMLKTLGTMAELMLPYILSHILKNVILHQSVKEILLWGLIMIIFSGIACLGNVLANRRAAFVAMQFAKNYRHALFEKTLSLSARQIDKFTVPSLEARITTDTYNTHHFVNMIQRMGIRAPILFVGGIIMTLIMDVRLALVMIAIAPPLFITVIFIRKKGVPLYSKVQKSVDSMIRVVREDSVGIRVIKALSKRDYEYRRYDEVNRTLIHDETKAGIVMGSVSPIMTLFMNGGIIAVVALAAFYVNRGISSPETVIAFMQYFTLISNALMAITRIFMMYTKCDASAQRVEEILNTPEDISVMSESDYPPVSTDAHIKFDNVNFSYRGKINNLDNISFELKKGGSLGIIGATGSGKSTLIKLLLRYYDTDSGAIYINGKNIRTYPKNVFYKMFGIAMQHDFLYNDTIEENIKFGRELSHEDVVSAAKIAQADSFITDFADGYEHILSQKGTNISGGQKQRILISRAIAAKPDILILDDSSSALDYKTDAALRYALNNSMSDTTVVTVAQRVSSIKDCDIIIVLEHGKIIGMGDHDFLMQSCTEYKEISDSQMGGAFVD